MGQVSDLGACREVQRGNFLRGLHQPYVCGGFPHGAEDFIVTFVADEEDNVTFAGKADGFEMDGGAPGAGGIVGVQGALGGGGADGRRHAVGAVKNIGPMRNFVDAVDKDHAALAKALDDVPIMNDFVVDEEESRKVQSAFETVDRHGHAGTETARLGQDYAHASLLDYSILSGKSW